MENLHDKIHQLLNKTEWTSDEKNWMLKYLETSDDQQLHDLLERQFEIEKKHPKQLDDKATKKMLQNIHERIGVVKQINKSALIKMWSLKVGVASVIAIAVSTTYSILKQNTSVQVVRSPIIIRPVKNFKEPGGNKAVLTLADGSTIVLDDKQNGALAEQAHTKVFKLSGKLVYNAANKNGNQILYNTITTAAEGQYQIELPDGTLVWLNSGSSLRFPTAFAGTERRVEVTGEAYFEVKRNTAMPFKVKVNDAEVQVLGTHFNIMAYGDEAIVKATLLEGKVKFVNGSFTSILKPGQQSQLSQNGQVKVVSGIDVEEVVAWKNGMFDFKGANLVSVAKQLSRWYDVEIVFDNEFDELFYAKIPRDTKLKDVLKALELTGKVRFEIKGQKIIVKPQH